MGPTVFVSPQRSQSPDCTRQVGKVCTDMELPTVRCLASVAFCTFCPASDHGEYFTKLMCLSSLQDKAAAPVLDCALLKDHRRDSW